MQFQYGSSRGMINSNATAKNTTAKKFLLSISSRKLRFNFLRSDFVWMYRRRLQYLKPVNNNMMIKVIGIRNSIVVKKFIAGLSGPRIFSRTGSGVAKELATL